MEIKDLHGAIGNFVRKAYLKKDVVSIYGYGSFFTGKFSEKSDIDIYVVVKKSDFGLLLRLKKFKNILENYAGMEVFINILEIGDLPSNSLFYHRDREVLFSMDFSQKFYHLYGRKIIYNQNFLYLPSRLIDECLRNIHVLLYISKKLVINEKQDIVDQSYDRRDIVKDFVKSLKYVNLLNGKYTYSADETVETFLSFAENPRAEYMKRIKSYLIKNDLRNLVSNTKELYFSTKIDENDVKRIIDMFEFIVSTLLDYFKKFDFLRGVKYTKNIEIKGMLFKRYKSPVAKNILFLPGMPNNPSDEFMWNYTLFGNIFLLENINFSELTNSKESLDSFFNTLENISKLLHVDTIFAASFSTIFLSKLSKIKGIKKIILLSPILTANRINKKLVAKAVREWMAQNKIKEDLGIFEVALSYEKLLQLPIRQKRMYIAYSTYNDRSLSQKAEIKRFEEQKDILVAHTSKRLHGYKLIADFDIWAGMLKFLGDER